MGRTAAALDWNDLRLCLAVARAGSLSAAGQELGLSHTTLLRRIAALEKGLGVTLFRRKTTGYELTEEGRAFTEAAGVAEEKILDALARVTGADQEMRGPLKVALPDLSGGALMAVVREFLHAHPEIRFEFLVSQRPSGLTLGEAHVALALTAEAPPGQVGVAIGPVAFAAYVRRDLAERAGPDGLAWVGLAPALLHAPVGRYDQRLAAAFAHRHLCSSLALQHAAIRSGLGVGVLACAIGDSDPYLVRCSAVQCDPELVLWLLHRRELKTNARVIAFFRHLRKALTERRRLIMGEEPAVAPRLLPILADLAD